MTMRKEYIRIHALVYIGSENLFLISCKERNKRCGTILKR
ncbi:hypothetical protein KsCSTR_18860 [Candidatus Kuenenia stuttgartiensis]|uniref:Uncharacterized protein n=1 Tax=Kuenenia stuttgartiensis TaxID=174633 RepID=A0A6G7GP00_KUEST|nr:hypothetical protein KsCSTR_18860 [Candidatus Kuenenia stuttgartiensis]